MSDNLTIEQLATELSGATEPEQPVEQDSIDGEAEQEPSDAPTDDDSDGEQPDADAAAQPEQPETDSEPAPIELEINGEKVQLSLEEVKNGYLRQQDYTQKAQNLARERQEAQARIQQEFQQVQSLAVEYGQLTNIDSQLQQYQQVNWQELRQTDPLSYSTHLAEMQNLRAMRGDLQAQIQGKQQYMQQQQQQTFIQQTQEAAQYLKTVIPNFGAETIKSMKDYGQKIGFAPEELSNVADKRMLQVLWEASQYRALQDKKPVAQKKVAALPTKATKAAAPAAPQSQTIQLEKRLSKTGSVRDFAALLSASRK